jgi:hypothetical protein
MGVYRDIEKDLRASDRRAFKYGWDRLPGAMLTGEQLLRLYHVAGASEHFLTLTDVDFWAHDSTPLVRVLRRHFAKHMLLTIGGQHRHVERLCHHEMVKLVMGSGVDWRPYAEGLLGMAVLDDWEGKVDDYTRSLLERTLEDNDRHALDPIFYRIPALGIEEAARHLGIARTLSPSPEKLTEHPWAFLDDSPERKSARR